MDRNRMVRARSTTCDDTTQAFGSTELDSPPKSVEFTWMGVAKVLADPLLDHEA